MTWHFDLLMIIGLAMLPGAFVVGFLLALIFASQELGAAAIGIVGIVVTFVAGIALFLVGLGQELH
jgi:hypothetical protein